MKCETRNHNTSTLIGTEFGDIMPSFNKSFCDKGQ